MSDLNNDVVSLEQYKSAAEKLAETDRMLRRALAEMRDFYRDNLDNNRPVAISFREAAWSAMHAIDHALHILSAPATPSAPAIVPGDLVKLATGKSPLMVVETTGNGGATCVWFDTAMTEHRATFSDAILTRQPQEA